MYKEAKRVNLWKTDLQCSQVSEVRQSQLRYFAMGEAQMGEMQAAGDH